MMENVTDEPPVCNRFDRFHRHTARQQEQKRGRSERRDAFDLAVTVMMFRIRRPIGYAHRDPGHQCRAEVDQAMQGIGYQRQTGDGDGRRQTSPPRSDPLAKIETMATFLSCSAWCAV